MNTLSIKARPVRIRFIWLTLLSVCVASLVVALVMWDPANSALFPPCPFRALTGYYCSGCGSLRAIHQLFHGHVTNALQFNPLFVLSLPFLGYAVLSAAFTRLRWSWIDRLARRPGWPRLVLAVLLLYWVLRNLPFVPFRWLAPA